MTTQDNVTAAGDRVAELILEAMDTYADEVLEGKHDAAIYPSVAVGYGLARVIGHLSNCPTPGFSQHWIDLIHRTAISWAAKGRDT